MYRATQTFTAGLDANVFEFEAGIEFDEDLGRRLVAMGCPVEPTDPSEPEAPAKVPRSRAKKPATTES